MPKVVTRFAPSPTGFLHIGGVRTALYAWLFARQQNGTFILRIEDTDKNREVTGSIAHIQESLNWLGIDWDFGPDKPGDFVSCLQSDRLNIYKAYAEKLVAKGLAYPDPYSQAELEKFREEANQAKKPFLYRDHRPNEFGTWDGTQPLRFKVEQIKRYHWHDAVRGDLEAGEEMLDDFVLIKADGYPTYNFAHIVDDFEMGVTHIMRADEFISSVPKFLSLYDALEITPPVFVTLPPIMGPDGKKKLSKRDGAKDILEYRDDGYLPEAMRNFLALVGWNPGGEQEIYHTKELIEAFSIEKIQRSGGAFNEEKLLWMNKEYLKEMADDEFFNYIENAIPASTKGQALYSEDRLVRLIPTLRERAHVAVEVKKDIEAGEYSWVFDVPKVETAQVKWKNDPAVEDVLPRLITLKNLLEKADFSSTETVKDAIWDYAEKTGKGEVLWPLRVTLTGKERSPDPFTCAYILGNTEVINRLERMIKTLQGL